jgi:hypothetical protein
MSSAATIIIIKFETNSEMCNISKVRVVCCKHTLGKKLVYIQDNNFKGTMGSKTDLVSDYNNKI